MGAARFADLPARSCAESCYAVVFSAQRTEGDHNQAYAAMTERMRALAAQQPGYIGIESAQDASGFGITVSYWHSEAAMKAWKANAEHMVAQRLGKTRWYRHYRVRVMRVERSYSGPPKAHPAQR